jgi:hypothetical protein
MVYFARQQFRAAHVFFLRTRYSDYLVFLVARLIGAIWYTRRFDMPISSAIAWDFAPRFTAAAIATSRGVPFEISALIRAMAARDLRSLSWRLVCVAARSSRSFLI